MDLPRTPSFRLDGRRAIVTGAGRGIGLALAAALAEAGAAVTLVARSGDEIEAGAAAIRAAGGQAEAAVLDGRVVRRPLEIQTRGIVAERVTLHELLLLGRIGRWFPESHG